MEINDYQRAALRTEKLLPRLERLTHAALGLATEVGEYTTEVKRAAIYGKPLGPVGTENMVEELGDVLWYVAVAADALGFTLDQVCQMNIEKLRIRFPDAYSNAAAEARADKGGLDARSS